MRGYIADITVEEMEGQRPVVRTGWIVTPKSREAHFVKLYIRENNMMPGIGDIIELVTDIPEKNLRTEMRDAVVFCHGNNIYEIEFINNDMDLKDLVTEQTKSIDKAKFEEINLISNVGLELSNFKEYIEKRKELLMTKLKKILN